MLHHRTTSFGALEELVGKLNFLALVYPGLKVYNFPLYAALNATRRHPATRPHSATVVPWTLELEHALLDLLLLLTAVHNHRVLRPASTAYVNLVADSNTVHITTDAAGDTGFGWATATEIGGGVWGPRNADDPIHVKELIAVAAALMHHASRLRNRPVVIWTDN